MPFVFLMLIALVSWNFFLNRDPYLSNEGQVELSSVAKKVDPDLYVGSYNSNPFKGDESILAFEDPANCGKDRLYLENDIAQIGEVFRKPRSNFTEAKIPVDCILYSMKSFMYSPSSSSQAFSYCKDDKGLPSRGQKTPCLTKDYVNSVYTAYVNVMDCLAIPQTDLLPKLLNESGFHTNVLGYGMDAGVGQLTGDAIKSVLQIETFGGVKTTYLDYHKEEMRKSGKESCNQVLSNLSLISEVSPKQDQRCSLIAVPENPLRNILYTAIFYRYLLYKQTGIIYSKGENFLLSGSQWIPWNEDGNFEYGGSIKPIEKMLVKAGLPNPNINAIKQMMITLGYNAGMNSAVILLKNYLKARTAAKLKVKASDFDFLSEDFSIFKPLKNPKAELARKTKEAQILKESFRGTFPVYLKLNQKTGTAGYLSFVAMKHKQLNAALGENKCTSQKYLQF